MIDAFPLLSESEYLHVLLNHLPITGLIIAAIVLVTALLMRNKAATVLGLALVLLLSLMVWPVSATGHNGSRRAKALSDKDGRAYLEYHETLAHKFNRLFYATGASAAVALLIIRKRPKFTVSASVVVLALTTMSLIGGFFVAESGGRTRHLEFRTGLPPGQEDDCHHGHQH